MHTTSDHRRPVDGAQERQSSPKAFIESPSPLLSLPPTPRPADGDHLLQPFAIAIEAYENVAIVPVCPPDHEGISDRHQAQCETPGKTPLVRWRQFQRTPLSQALVEEWAKKFPHANVAMITGPPSGISVLDVDPDRGGLESLKRYPKLPPTVETGGGGLHFYFTRKPFLPKTGGEILPGVEWKDDGRYVIIPPSIHQSGCPYRLVGGIIPRIPEWLIDLLHSSRGGRDGAAGGWAGNALCVKSGNMPANKQPWVGVQEGRRTTTAKHLAAQAFNAGVSEPDAVERLLAWNFKNSPPMPPTKVMAIVKWVYSRFEPAKKRPEHVDLRKTPWAAAIDAGVLKEPVVKTYEAICALTKVRGWSADSRLFTTLRLLAGMRAVTHQTICNHLDILEAAGLIGLRLGKSTGGDGPSGIANSIKVVLPVPKHKPGMGPFRSRHTRAQRFQRAVKRMRARSASGRSQRRMQTGGERGGEEGASRHRGAPRGRSVQDAGAGGCGYR